MTKEITIVTAFFDIGRGNISTEAGYPSYLIRSNDTYFSYFAHLAKLENDMVVFTTEEHVQRILALREGRPTKVVVFDFFNKLRRYRKRINQIQQDPHFIARVNPAQRKNIEYWSADYVLVNNLKTYFVNKAIQDEQINTDLVAWVDFGYCRDASTTHHLTKWQYDFDANYVHLFTLSEQYSLQSYDDVLQYIFCNKSFVVGGGIVASKQKWFQFLNVLHRCQKHLLKQGISDDDQGLYMFSLYTRPDLFKLNYLGGGGDGLPCLKNFQSPNNRKIPA